MRILLSWSGTRSFALAKVLQRWLPAILPAIKPWTSDGDIPKGKRWREELSKQLEQTAFGVICLTPGNLNAPWILFEAGAISNHTGRSVCTYLLGLNPTELREPLLGFQATRATKEDTLKLLVTLNESLGETRLTNENLEIVFERKWPELEEAINKLPLDENREDLAWRLLRLFHKKTGITLDLTENEFSDLVNEGLPEDLRWTVKVGKPDEP
jgi:hypothetical protein